ncbi:MAG: hypothetical protein IKE63_02815 [Bacilli bacterium]|nr:hypothetical protein [Bacilli bacterium]
MDNKEDIDKLDKQINSLLQKEIDDSSEIEEEGREVFIDRKYAYDDIKEGDTKRIDKIDDIDDTIVEEKDEEEQKKETRVSRLEESEEKKTRVERLEEQENLEEEPKEKMSKKKKIIIICSIVGTFLLIVIILFLVLHKNKNIETDVEEKLSSSEQKEIIEDYGNELKKVIAGYYAQQKVLLKYDDAIRLVDFDYDVVCSEHEIYDNREVYLNKCTINKTKTRYSYGKKQEEVVPEQDDGKIKVYVNKETNKATFKEPDNKDKYDIYGFSIAGDYSDLNLLNESSDYVYYLDKSYSVHMINYKTDTKALNPLNYTNILPIENEGELDSSYVAVEMNGLWGIYNLATRERVVNHEYKMIDPRDGSTKKIDVKTIDLDAVKVFDGESFGIINYKTGKEIIPVIYNAISRSGDYLLTTDKNNNAHILDFNNKEYLKNYDKVYGIVDGKYALIKDEKSIKMVKPDGKELFDYGEVKVSNKIRYTSSSDVIYYVFNISGEKVSEKDAEYLEITYDVKKKKGKVEILEYNDIFN